MASAAAISPAPASRSASGATASGWSRRKRDPQDGDGRRHRAAAAAFGEQQRLDLLHLRHGERAHPPGRAAERDDLGLRPHHDASAKDQVITVPVGSAKQEKSNSGMTKSSSLVCIESFEAVQALSFSDTAWPWKVVKNCA